MRDSFSSELGDVDVGHGDSFSSEFRGASASLIEQERPPRSLDAGRRTRRVVLGLLFTLALVGGGGWALWFWSEPIGEWVASWRSTEAPAASEPVAGPAEPSPGQPDPGSPSEAPRDQPAPQAGPEPGPEPGPDPIPGPVPGELPVEPLDRLPGTDGEGLPVEALDAAPIGADGRPQLVSTTRTTVRGRVSDVPVTAQLASVDEALHACWAREAAAHGRSATLTLRFTIKWNGRLVSTEIDGDAPAAVERCVREALPASGWPKPSDGGEAIVSRQWRLHSVL